MERASRQNTIDYYRLNGGGRVSGFWRPGPPGACFGRRGLSWEVDAGEVWGKHGPGHVVACHDGVGFSRAATQAKRKQICTHIDANAHSTYRLGGPQHRLPGYTRRDQFPAVPCHAGGQRRHASKEVRCSRNWTTRRWLSAGTPISPAGRRGGGGREGRGERLRSGAAGVVESVSNA